MILAKKICFWVLTAIVLVYFFIVISPRIIKGFYPFGIKTAVVVSGSMEPEIEINDFVVMKQPDGIKVGDIVTYESADVSHEVMHRIIKTDGDEIITKGDANNTEDKPISESQITGIYIGKVPVLGKIISFIIKPIVFIIIVVMLLVWIFWPVKKGSNKPKEKTNEKV